MVNNVMLQATVGCIKKTMKGCYKMKKERVRINLDISKDLNEKLRKQADKQDMTMNALIRIALEKYLKEVAE